MALSENKVSVQNFTKGLNTDYHELNCPPDVTVDEANCELNRKGFRQRRLGLAYEDGYAQNGAQYDPVTMGQQYLKSYRWNNVNNDGTTNFLIIQTGATLSFYTLAATPTSSGLKSFTVNLNTYAAPGITDTSLEGISVASGNGVLFVAGSLINPFYIKYNVAADTITVTPISIMIRDLIEQDATLSNDNRPTTLTAGRQYDLYNQGWNTNNVKLYYSTVGPADYSGVTTVLNYYRTVEGKYPPKTGPWWIGKRIGDKGIEVFDPSQFDSVSTGNTLGALGHFIVNAFNIDRSAISGIAGLTPQVNTNRPTAVAFFAGKVFYVLGNTIYYSQTITDGNDLSGVGKCYMEADPTSEQINDLVATDGGTITIPESAEGVAFFVIENCLTLFATNGTWLVSGGSTNSGFSATDYSINKISDVSCVSSRSLINADGVPIWWAPQGIYTMEPISTKQSFSVKNVSLKRVQNFYDAIAPLAKVNATGCWDHIQKRAIWLFSSASNQSNTSNRFYYNDMLVYDGLFDAYLHHTISDNSEAQPSKMVDIFNIQQIQTSSTIEVITDNSGNQIVDHTGAAVTINLNSLVNTSSVTHDTNYMVVGPVGITGSTGTTNMTVAFADFTSCDFLDWSDYTTIGLGADYTSYLDCYYTIAGYMTPHFEKGYDAMMWMYSPYVYVFLDQPARACQTTVITIPGLPAGTTTNQIMAYYTTDGLVPANAHGMAYDFTNNRYFRLYTNTSAANDLIRSYDGSSTGAELLSTTAGTLGVSGTPTLNSQVTVANNGSLVWYTNASPNQVVCVDGSNLTLQSTFPGGSSGSTSARLKTPLNFAPLSFGNNHYVISAENHDTGTSGHQICALTVPTLTNALVGRTDEAQPVVGRGKSGATSGTAVIVARPAAADLPTTTGVGIYTVTGSLSGFTLVKAGMVLPAAIDATWTHISGTSGAVCDQHDGGIIFVATTADSVTTKQYIVKVSALTAAVIWTSAITASQSNLDATLTQANIKNQVLFYMDNSHVLRQISTVDGSQTNHTVGTLTGGTLGQISDDSSYSIILSGTPTWTEASTHPTYTGTYMNTLGNHTFGGQDGRYWIDGIVTPGTPDTYVYSTEITPNASSCLLQVAWDWSSSSASHKWAQQLETYKYRANFLVSTSKNKVRGKGKAMQLRFSSTTGKDFNLIGWGIWYTKNQHP